MTAPEHPPTFRHKVSPLVALRKEPTNRHGSKKWGRIWLFVMFLVLVAFDVSFYFIIPEQRRHTLVVQRLIGSGIINAVWYSVLLFAIGMRQAWARYFLVLLLLVAVVFSVAIIADLLYNYSLDTKFVIAIVANVASKIGVACFLIASPDIRHLTNKFYT